MIRCYLLHLEAVLLKPPGDLIDIIPRNAEARRVIALESGTDDI